MLLPTSDSYHVWTLIPVSGELLFLTTFIKFPQNRENDTLKEVTFVASHRETNRPKQLAKYFFTPLWRRPYAATFVPAADLDAFRRGRCKQEEISKIENS